MALKPTLSLFDRNAGCWVLALGMVALLTGCGASRPWVAKPQRNWQALPAPSGPDTAAVRMLYLIGDAGKASAEQMSPAQYAAEASLAEPFCTSLVYVFLGDNIYSHGLSHPESPTHSHELGLLEGQLVMGYTAPYAVTHRIFIPGNHDWGNTDTAGWRRVMRQEAEVEARNEQPNNSVHHAFMPSAACPWPEALDVGPWRIIAFNFDYFLYPHASTRPASENACPGLQWPTVRDSLARALAQAQAQGRQLLVLNHHPTLSNGSHGGHYTWQDHIFPLRVARKWLWIPLPGLGSLYPLLRKASKNFTDITHPAYAQMARDVEAVLAQHPGAVYACGHEHILQYNARPAAGGGVWHHVLSGSGSQYSPARRGLGAQFVYAGQGFARLLEFENGQVWLEYIRPNRRRPYDGFHVVYRVQVR